MNLRTSHQAIVRPGVLRRERVRRAELQDRMSPFVAGWIAGIIGGPVALYAANQFAIRHSLPELSTTLASFFAAHGLHEGASVAPFVVAALLGACVGAMFAVITRHLRRTLPLLFWSCIFFPAMCTLLCAFVMPHLHLHLPFTPMLVGSAVFGFCLALQLPLRARKTTPWVDH